MGFMVSFYLNITLPRSIQTHALYLITSINMNTNSILHLLLSFSSPALFKSRLARKSILIKIVKRANQ